MAIERKNVFNEKCSDLYRNAESTESQSLTLFLLKL